MHARAAAHRGKSARTQRENDTNSLLRAREWIVSCAPSYSVSLRARTCSPDQEKSMAAKKSGAKKSAAKKGGAKKSAAKKGAAKKGGAKKAAKSGAKKGGAKKAAKRTPNAAFMKA